MLDIHKVRAVSLDLDDTLWPVWPTIERAEMALHGWLGEHAPNTAALYSSLAARREIRDSLAAQRPDLLHDLSALRRESIRLALIRAGDAPELAEPAFEVFFAARQQVEFYDDALAALAFLSRRYPLVALSNGNADVQRIGIAQHFHAAVSAREFGVSKPDARIFHAAAGAARVRPGEVLHIGDDATLDARGALDAGLQAVWINRAGLAWPHDGPAPVTLASLSELFALFPGDAGSRR
ncbi:MAG: HAD family hydrolase [Burkholderiaceae bacterium]|nr:MAG: HAD family hydrolase [Burkholderiaceae bacterium]